MYANRIESVTPVAPTSVGAVDRARHDAALARDATPPAERAAWGPAREPSGPPQVAAGVGAEGVVASHAAAPRAPGGPDATTLAKLSQDVYLDVAAPPQGYRVASEAELARIGVTPAMLATQPNGFRARAYVAGSGADTQVVIAFRGTATRGDWVADARQALGMNTDHYRRALDIGRAVAASGAGNVTFTGHSLGGGLASAAGLAGGDRTVTFNAAGLSKATIDGANAIRTAAGRDAPDIRAYHVRGEVLSALQDGGDRVLGALLFGPLGATIDAPPAYGTRIQLDAVTPAGKHWWNNNPVDKHGMDWVLAGLNAR